jgi:hypothetical protein
MTRDRAKKNDIDNNRLPSTVLLLISLMPDILTDHEKGEPPVDKVWGFFGVTV